MLNGVGGGGGLVVKREVNYTFFYTSSVRLSKNDLHGKFNPSGHFVCNFVYGPYT